MRKLYPLFIVLSFIACESKHTTNAETTNSALDTLSVAGINPFNDRHLIDSVFQENQPSYQTYNISTEKNQTIYTSHGLEIKIIPTNLETINGNMISGNIEVAVAELYTKTDLLKSRAQTVSNDRLLVSAGAFNIKISANGEAVRIKENKSLDINIPKVDRSMSLFYGARDSNGVMDWQQTSNGIKYENVDSSMYTEVIDTIFQTNTGTYDDLDKGTYAGTKKVSKGDLTKAKSIYALLGAKEETDTIAYKINKRKVLKTESVVQSSMKLTKLGWINIDKFYKGEMTNITYTVNKNDSIGAAQIFVVFTDINSVIQDFYGEHIKQENSLKGPLGKKAILIAFGVIKGVVYVSRQNIDFQKGNKYPVQWQKASEVNIGDIFKI